MLMNSLCALALGFVLDMLLGDPAGGLYPLTLIKKLVKALENTLRKAYADSPEAQNMAGVMLIVMTLVICLGISAGILLVCYKLSVVAGIIAEGILCWISISSKYMRISVRGVFRAARSGNIVSARRYLKKISCRDVDSLDMDEAMRCAVESASENTIDWIIAPIFWIGIFGGMGGIFCRCVNILDNTVGYKTEEYRHFGKYPAALDDVVMFFPARIAAALMRLDVSFLSLDGKNARRIYRRDRKKSLSPNSGCTQSVCAGALGIQLGSDEYYGGQLVRRPVIGIPQRPIEPSDVYWANQLSCGTAAYGVVLCFIIKTAISVAVAFI
ncbi:MAG: cobalamin biosynthesis protein CobD [Ruminococcus sp.]|nr:cobalamin biosynthesis protein CobD [Ruminococcus sp.]